MLNVVGVVVGWCAEFASQGIKGLRCLLLVDCSCALIGWGEGCGKAQRRGVVGLCVGHAGNWGVAVWVRSVLLRRRDGKRLQSRHGSAVCLYLGAHAHSTAGP